jgi:hypothetical protein
MGKNFYSIRFKIAFLRCHLMKRKTVPVFLLILLTSCLLFLEIVPKAKSQTEQVTEWTKTYGGTESDYAYSVVQTSDGGYAIAGESSSFQGLTNFWVVKTSASGDMLWNRTYGSTYSCARSIVLTADGGYAIAGYDYSAGQDWDFYLVKTDASGNMEWNMIYGGPEDDEAYSVIATSDGGYAITGRTRSFGAGSHDLWLVKTDAFGNMEWNRTFGGILDDFAQSLIETSDGGYILAGRTRSFGAGESDVWLVKTDAVGNHQWNKTYGGANIDYATSILQTRDGGYAIAGATDAGFLGMGGDMWLVKTDAVGNQEWNRTFGGSSTEYPGSVVQTGEGGYALAGTTYSFGAGSSDAWLIKTDEYGYLEWGETYGGSGRDFANSIVQTSDGGYALAGYTESFGAGSEDFLLIKTELFTFTYENDIYFGENSYRVSVTTNSILKETSFLQNQKQLSYNVTGPTGTFGFCNISIPEDLLWGDFAVYLDGEPLVENVDYTRTYNGTHNTFYISYTHSSHLIKIIGSEIIPEFISLFTLSLLTVTILAATIANKKLNKNKTKKE